MKRLAYFVCVIALSACNVKFDTQIPVLPGLQGTFPSQSPNTQGSLAPTTPTPTGEKKAILSLNVSQEIQDETDLVPFSNCIQIVQEPDQSVFIDFSDVSCPGSSLPAASARKFTAGYKLIADRTYELYFENAPIGVMEIDFDAARADLKSLCSGSYNDDCYLATVGGKIDGIISLH